MTIEERVQLFFDIQQTLANDLGLAFPVKHGEDFPLYDLWEGKLLDVKINKGVRIKKQDGKVTVEEFDRTEEESECGKENDKQREESEG